MTKTFQTLLATFALAVTLVTAGNGTTHPRRSAEDLETSESQYVQRTVHHSRSAYYPQQPQYGAHQQPQPQQYYQPAAAPSVVHESYQYSDPYSKGSNGYSVHFRKEYYDPRATCSDHYGQSGTCKPLVSCSIHYTELVGALQTPCYLPDGMTGVCCQDQTPAPYAPANDILIEVKGRKPIRFPKISPYEVAAAVKTGLKQLEKVQNLEKDLFKKNIVISRETSASYHQKFFTTTRQALAIGLGANKNLEACKSLVDRFSLSKEQALFGLPSLSLKETAIEDTCLAQPTCDPESRYRMIDGSCNNLQKPNWGRARTAMQRIIEADYSDGLFQPRNAQSGRPLPSARLVSANIVADVDRPFRNLTLMVMQWGQFLDHDLTHTPVHKGENQSGIKCCDEDGRTFIRPELRHPACLPIEIPRDDPYYARYGQICMEFVRSLPGARDDCAFGARQQMDQITHFIDASNVYGSDPDETQELRSLRGGRLKVTRVGEKDLLPLNTDMMDECTDPKNNLFCFKAGDARVNEQVELTTMHTLWMREHNRIADELARLNPYWNDETIFQEARRLVAAEMQHITYNEWLPIVLGSHFMQNYSLHSQPYGYTYQYDPTINPSITNAFSTAALRFGHTLIQGFMQMWNKFGSVSRVLELHDTFFKPFELYRPDSYDGFLRGLANQPCQQYDQFFTESVVGKLFQTPKLPFGMDLVALNIQRARDHGIPSYNEYRAECGLKKAVDFKDLSDFISYEAIKGLKEIYESVDDIDLFIGGILERPLFEGGGIVGPTFTCILGDQFARLKRGDRFYYEEGKQTGSFTPHQLESIRTVSLARIICDNGDDIQAVQPLVFFQPSETNPRVPCSSYAIPLLNLGLWQAEQPAGYGKTYRAEPNGW